MSISKPSPKVEKVAALVSSGLGSIALLEHLAESYKTVYPLYIQSGFRWEEAELFWLKKYFRSRKWPNIETLEILQLPQRDIYQFHWSVTGVRVPGASTPAADLHIPGRDLIIWTKGAMAAFWKGISHVAVGYVDQPENSHAVKHLLPKAERLLSDSFGEPITLLAPFIGQDRRKLLESMKENAVDSSFSCVSPRGLQHCGDCWKCAERQQNAEKSGIADKTYYHRALSQIISA